MACFAEWSETWRADQSQWQSCAVLCWLQPWAWQRLSVTPPLASIPHGERQDQKQVHSANTINSCWEGRGEMEWVGWVVGGEGGAGCGGWWVAGMTKRGCWRRWKYKRGGWKEKKIEGGKFLLDHHQGPPPRHIQFGIPQRKKLESVNMWRYRRHQKWSLLKLRWNGDCNFQLHQFCERVPFRSNNHWQLCPAHIQLTEETD